MTDNENHRINECIKYSSINNHDHVEKFEFSIVFSDTVEKLQTAAQVINRIWDLANGKNTMRCTDVQWPHCNCCDTETDCTGFTLKSESCRILYFTLHRVLMGVIRKTFCDVVKLSNCLPIE